MPLPGKVLEIDYARYGRGEAQMAWLDAKLSLSFTEGAGQQLVLGIIDTLLKILDEKGVAIGHLKFVLTGGGQSAKVSLTGLEELGWWDSVPDLPGEEIEMLVNMRAETSADQLHQSLQQALERVLDQMSFEFEESNLEFFHPVEPKPTYRIS